VLVEDFRPAELARQYEKGGAAALSVLTDRDFLSGQPRRPARRPRRLHPARHPQGFHHLRLPRARSGGRAGADAILLIVAILDDAELARPCANSPREFGMAALVEAHDARNWNARALRTPKSSASTTAI
jgi:indole-3-glycerol phosphate synthase